MVLSFECLFKHMQLLIEIAQSLSFSRNLSNCVQNRGVVAPAKQFTNLWQAFLGQFFGQIHGNLARSCDRGGTLLGVHVRDFDFVIVCHGFLNVFNRNLPVLNR